MKALLGGLGRQAKLESTDPWSAPQIPLHLQ
jgi:hypothetical protein